MGENRRHPPVVVPKGGGGGGLADRLRERGYGALRAAFAGPPDMYPDLDGPREHANWATHPRPFPLQAPPEGEKKSTMVRVYPHRLHGHAYWYAWLAAQMGEHALPGAGVLWEVKGAYAPPPKGPDGGAALLHVTELNTRGVEFTPTHALYVSVALPIHALMIERMFCVAEIATWEGGPVAALVSLMSGFLGDIHTKYPNIATLAAENTKRT